jgi:ribose 5-phosphate isomerase B
MRLVAGSDHAAIPERLALVEHLKQAGHEVKDLGTPPGTTADYPDVALAVARAVASGEAERGFLLCGTGLGVCMTANKVPGVRAAPLADDYTAEMARRHNDANVACFGGRLLSAHAVLRLADRFLATPFDGGRHAPRVDKINALDRARRPVG